MSDTLKADVTYLFNQSRHLPKADRLRTADTMLSYLDSPDASLAYPAHELVYLRKVWIEVRERWESYENDVDQGLVK